MKDRDQLTMINGCFSSPIHMIVVLFLVWAGFNSNESENKIELAIFKRIKPLLLF